MDQEQYIRENYKKIPSKQIAETLEITYRRVQHLARKYGLAKFSKEIEAKIPDILKDYYEERLPVSVVRKRNKIGKSTCLSILSLRGSGGRETCETSVRYDCNLKFFDKIDTPEKAYWFGFIAADGNLCNGKIQIRLNKKDRNHLEKFCRRLDYSGPIFEEKEKNIVGVIITRKPLYKSLKKLGLEENKTLVINENIFNSVPENLLAAAMLGYFDGDGCFSFSRGHITASLVGNESFLLFFKDFVDKFDIWMPEPKKDKRTKQTFGISSRITEQRAIGYKKMFYENEFSSKDFLDRKKKILYDKFPDEPSF